MREALFGSFDGLTSVLGVIAAAYLVGNTHVPVAAACGLAIAAAVSADILDTTHFSYSLNNNRKQVL